MERIIIKNFGPIKDVDLQINDFMIFIGPQASGKSTIAKLIYFYKNLHNEIRKFLFERIANLGIREFSEKYEQNYALGCLEFYFFDIFPDTKIYKGSNIYFYFNANFALKIKIDNNGELNISLPIEFANDFERTLSEAKELYDIDREDFNSAATKAQARIDSFIIKTLDRTFSDNLYIPAGRGFISVISSQIFNLKTENLDYFIKEFAYAIRFIRNDITLSESNLINQSEELKEKYLSIYRILNRLQSRILKGRYLYDKINQKTGIEIGNNDFIPLDKVSSGQQEAVWVVQYLIYRIYQISLRSSFTVIEEPEAHLYPESQKSITELIAVLVNLLNNQALITTHSPYILAAVNNLLYANKIGKTHEKEVSEIVDKNLWLDFNRVDAYFVGGEGNEGKIKRIMDDELEMIENQYLDSASSIINQEFDLIYDLED
ncbi:AAA family ATPase [Emticicia sp. 21SJ11W-3]|uniref:AAA family ATPase n=1 Tax=Emticicia sp. 21SJ11W-3 TaxID=2916755 RepID=UPI0020A211D5|nr:AAA family ATPase [Emticicia sp. 21SJ11W-3]UTA69164.1 ATP-binding protein [Emticicia sp. 21SJ11W-3]